MQQGKQQQEVDKGSPTVHARGTVLQSDACVRNKEMCVPPNATITHLVAINSVEAKCSINVGQNKGSNILQLLLFFSS